MTRHEKSDSGCKEHTNKNNDSENNNYDIGATANNKSNGILNDLKKAVTDAYSEIEPPPNLQNSNGKFRKRPNFLLPRHFQSTKCLVNFEPRSFSRRTQSLPKLDPFSEYRYFVWNDDAALKQAEDIMFGINGKKQSNDRAFKFLKIIRKFTKSPRALALLGFCYEFGIGCEIDYEKCLYNYWQAERKSDTLAMSRLCDLYIFNVEKAWETRDFYFDLMKEVTPAEENKEIGLLKSENTSSKESQNSKQEREFAQGPLKWLWWAANSCTNAHAQYALGSCFHHGAGTSKNLELAIKWYWKSARQGCGRGECSLGLCYLYGDGVKQNDKAANRLLTQAATRGESFAMYQLGYCYENGLTVSQSYAKARELYVRAMHGGYRPTATRMGSLYKNGIGVARDLRHAAQWYHIASHLECTNALFLLGESYEKGIGVPKDEVFAHLLYLYASNDLEDETKNKVGLLPLANTGKIQNAEEAVFWFRCAAELNCYIGCVSLAYCLENGLGTPVDPEGALQAIERAIKLNYNISEDLLFERAESLGTQISCRRIAKAAQKQIEDGFFLLASAV